MCLRPKKISVRRGPRYEVQEVACRNCKICRVVRENDLVGRCMAERRNSDQSFFLTLTYRNLPDGTEPAHVHILNKEHLQKFFRALRDRGYSVRYLSCGEFGTQKGRGHWHVVLFFKGKPLGYEVGKFRQMAEWPHGHVDIKECDSASAIRYAVKYLEPVVSEHPLTKTSERKKKKADNPTEFLMSTRPELGHEYFQKLALDHVEMGVAPTGFEYWPPDHLKHEGNKNHRFKMGGSTKKKYAMTFVLAWLEKYGELDLSRMSETFASVIEKAIFQIQVKAEAERRKLSPDQVGICRDIIEGSRRDAPSVAQVEAADRRLDVVYTFAPELVKGSA